MTTETEPRAEKSRLGRLALSLILSAVVGCAGAGRRGGLTDAEESTLPAEVRPSYELFAQRCSRCHTLARPLGSGITDKEHWRLYVGRMRRHPGSGISKGDAEIILQFLDYYSDRKGEFGGAAGESNP